MSSILSTKMNSVPSITTNSDHGDHLSSILRFSTIVLLAAAPAAAKLQSDASAKVGTDVFDDIKVGFE